MEREYYVYILINLRNTVLYTGITNNVQRRLREHREKKRNSFVARYNVFKLVFYEVYDQVDYAIAREKQIKASSRKDKLDLINKFNPEWKELGVR